MLFILDLSLEVCGERRDGAGGWLRAEAGLWLRGGGAGPQEGPGGAREGDGAARDSFTRSVPLNLLVLFLEKVQF